MHAYIIPFVHFINGSSYNKYMFLDIGNDLIDILIFKLNLPTKYAIYTQCIY